MMRVDSKLDRTFPEPELSALPATRVGVSGLKATRTRNRSVHCATNIYSIALFTVSVTP
jgi:hypothetical protein